MNADETAQFLAEGLAEDGLVVQYKRKGGRLGAPIAWTDDDIKHALQTAFLSGWKTCEEYYRKQVSA